MNREALEQIVDRASMLFDGDGSPSKPSGSISVRTVQLRLIEPLLEVLGWDGTSPAVEPLWPPADPAPFDYALLVDDTPQIAVDVVDPVEGLDGAAVAAFGDRLGRVGLDWGIQTDGQRFVFLAADNGGWARRSCTIDELPEKTTILTPYHKTETVRRVDEKAAIVTALQAERDRLVDDITACFEDATATEHHVFERVAGDAVSAAITALEQDPSDTASNTTQSGPATDGASDPPTDEGPTDVSARPESSTHPQSRPDTNRSEAATEDSDGNRRGALPEPSSGSSSDPTAAGQQREGSTVNSDSGQSTASDQRTPAGVSQSTPVEADTTASTGDAGEFVIRFFGGSSTVGAVGNPTPGGALYAACAYLQEHRALTNHLSTPWGVDDDRAILSRDPVHPDGSPMESAREMGSYYVWTGGTESECRRAIESLATVAGLRVMFQGDWTDSDQ